MSAILTATDVAVRYPLPRTLGDVLRGKHRALHAVDGVSLEVQRGETLGVVGESGCGKSSLGRALLGLEPLAGGQVLLDGEPVAEDMGPEIRRRAQMIFQDPVGALNPILSVAETLAEPIRVHGLLDDSEIPDRVTELMRLVGLQADLAERHPRELSGGQCQRVGIARALAVEPDLLIADECVSALDVSIQAQVLELLATLRQRLGLTIVYISHDLGVVRQFCDRVAVLYLGRIIELGPVETIFDAPGHPYTQSLIDAAPVMRPDAVLPDNLPPGEPPSPSDRPAGCHYHPRCTFAFDACRTAPHPTLQNIRERSLACNLNGGAGLGTSR